MALKFSQGKATDPDAPPPGWTAAQWARVGYNHKDRIRSSKMLPAPTDSFRSTVYRIGEGVSGVEDDIAMINDAGVKAAFAKLKMAEKEFFRVLNARVAWD